MNKEAYEIYFKVYSYISIGIVMKEFEVLLEELAVSSDIETQCTVISRLGETGKKEALNFLVKYLSKEIDTEIKSHIANAIIKISRKKASIQLLLLLRHKSWVTRMKATEILGEIGDKKAVYPLIRILRIDSEPVVKEWAAISLGKIGDKKASKPLVASLLSDPNYEIRMESANALGLIMEKKSINSLLDAYYMDEDYRVKWAAASALVKLDEEKSREIINELSANLIDILRTEKDEAVIGAAAKTLGEIGDEISAKVLLKTIKISRELVRLEINLALGRMAKRFNYQTKEEFVKNIQ